MDNDDRQIGRVLTRREALVLLGASGITLLGGCRTSNTRSDTASGTGAGTGAMAAGDSSAGGMCVVRPEQTQGPYFVDEMLDRADIRSDPTNGSVKAGTPLDLTINVSRLNGSACSPLAGAQVDIWQCDAVGVYSDARDRSFDTTGQKFLRGYQRTNAAGNARFTTIYPGWYPGRTVHIHFKIRTTPSGARGEEFTSQLYFDDALTDTVHAQAPYASKGPRTGRNAGDGIFRRGGSQLILAVVPSATGYASTFNVALQTS